MNLNSIDIKRIDEITHDRKMTIKILNYLAEVEEADKKAFSQRQKELVHVAMSKGIPVGRPRSQKPENWETIANNIMQGKISAEKAFKELNVCRSTAYRWLKAYKEKVNIYEGE